MATLSSGRWKQRQARDPFVRRARSEGWPSRAVFKLAELQQRELLLRPGDRVIDLGAAPGAWSRYATEVVREQGRVIAVDLLPMTVPQGVVFLQGDFTDAGMPDLILKALEGRQADVLLSDMAPNMSGNRTVDQPRTMLLAELVLDLADRALKPGGHLVIKLFQGEGFQDFLGAVRQRFERVRLRKPAASRQGSRETYLVARNFRL